MKEINLEEIFFNEFEKSKCNVFTLPLIISAMREACKQTLELAAKNAKTKLREVNPNSDILYYGYIVDKQSILDTINQIK